MRKNAFSGNLGQNIVVKSMILGNIVFSVKYFTAVLPLCSTTVRNRLWVSLLCKFFSVLHGFP